MTESTNHPLSGLWKPTHLQGLHYGPSCVQNHLVSTLSSPSSKAFVITGSSLASKTPLVKQVEELLGSKHHAGTFSNIKQHAPITQLDEATSLVEKAPNIDTLISLGGGSPIDSAKAISYRQHEKSGKYLYHITIPTTLSAAECSTNSGFTRDDGIKIGVQHPELAPHIIFYDSQFALHTPQSLWLSTGIRALDHAVELLYHPTSTEIPCKQLCLSAISGLFEYLPKYKAEPHNEDYITRLQLAAYSSLGFLGTNSKGGLGLSHTLGYALGSPYGIPHGITSCLTLGSVVKLKAAKPADAEQLARALPYIGQKRSGNDKEDAMAFGDAITQLVKELGLESNLRSYDVGDDQGPKIASTAAGTKDGELYERVLGLVRSIY